MTSIEFARAFAALSVVLATGAVAQTSDPSCPLDAKGRCTHEWCKTHMCWEFVDANIGKFILPVDQCPVETWMETHDRACLRPDSCSCTVLCQEDGKEWPADGSGACREEDKPK
jgi:hypothetical protein